MGDAQDVGFSLGIVVGSFVRQANAAGRNVLFVTEQRRLTMLELRPE